MARGRAVVAVFLMCCAVAFLALGPPGRAWSGEAFVAFYCAGDAIAAGEDPSLIEPLRTCEHRNAPSMHPGYAEPAPLPAYALAPFALLSRLPYGAAAVIFIALSLVAFVVTGFVLSNLARLPVVTAFGAIAVVDGFVDIACGEITTIAIGALCLAGYFAARGRDSAAGAAAAVSMIEPHIGLGACLALFLWRPNSRPALLTLGALSLALSLGAVGPHEVVRYFERWLPLQALSETSAYDQYSLTWIAHLLGASDPVAVRIGSISYLVQTLAGVLVARAVARRFDAPELIVFIPCAASTLFGVFVHDIELPAAMPAALIVAARARHPIAWLALVPLAIDWMPWWYATHADVVLASASLAGLAWGWAADRELRYRIAASAGAAIAYVAGLKIFAHIPQVPIGAQNTPWPDAASLGPTAGAALSWGALVRMEAGTAGTLQSLVGKLVVWIALIVVLGLAFRFDRRRRASRAAHEFTRDPRL